MYKLLNVVNKQYVTYTSGESVTTIPFDAANTDYQNFKKEINEGTARLQNAEGELYTKEQAKVVVSSLP